MLDPQSETTVSHVYLMLITNVLSSANVVLGDALDMLVV